MGVQPLLWVATALCGVALLHSTQRAEAGWHERLSQDLEYDEQHGNFATETPFTHSSYGSSIGKQDETLTLAGHQWFGQQETLEGRGDTTLTAEHSFSSSHVSYEPPQSARLGSSLLSLAQILESSTSGLSSALLRHFRGALPRLPTRFVGVNNNAEGRENPLNNYGLGKTEFQAAAEGRISVLASKLAGVLGAAEGYADSGKALAEYMVVPFITLLQQVEQLLSDIALHGDADLMTTALKKLGPFVVRGLSYLNAPQSQGASGVLEPARRNCLQRAKELDSALFEAQNDLEGVMRAYPRDLDANELPREQELLNLNAYSGPQQYIPPVFQEFGAPPSWDADKFRKRASIAVMAFFCLFFLAMFVTVAKVSRPLMKLKRSSRHRASRKRPSRQRRAHKFLAKLFSNVEREVDRVSRKAEEAHERIFNENSRWSREAEEAHERFFNENSRRSELYSMPRPANFSTFSLGSDGSFMGDNGFP